MKYKMIIFDADDTLYDFSKAEAFAFEHAVNDVGLVYESRFLPIYKELNIKIWEEFEQGLISQKELKQERFRRFLDSVNLEADTKLFSDSFLDNLAKASFLFDGAETLVKELSETYRLVMITNGLTRVQKYRVRNHTLAQYFEKVIISEEIGYKKPDPMIFIEGLKDLKPVDKEDIIIIGDSLTSDIQGGINYGIDTCWYNLHDKMNTSRVTPTFIATDYVDIRKLFLTK